MSIDFRHLMDDALALTRGGKLQAATETIQRALQRLGALRPDAPASPAPPRPPPVDATMVVDVPAREVPSTGSPATAAPAAAPTPPTILTGRFMHPSAGARSWRLAVPSTPAPAAGRPLLVMLHGCTQNAADFALGTGMDRKACALGWLVLYPEQEPSMNPQGCWNWFKPRHQTGDAGESAWMLARIDQVLAEHGGDPRRVYVAGLSAGGAMAANLARSHPERFAAVGIHSGLAAGAASSIPGALQAMRKGAPGARLAVPIPTIVLHGDADTVVAPANADAIVQAATPTGARRLPPQAVEGATCQRIVDAAGEPVVEQWTLHGLGHGWAGGDASGSWTERSPVDASAQMLRFFGDRVATQAGAAGR